jgi:signal peptidase I
MIKSRHKAKRFLHEVASLYHRRKKKLAASVQGQIEVLLTALDQALEAEENEKAFALCDQLSLLSQQHLKKSSFDQLRDLFFALAFALIVATLVRQLWFEFYEIPTGSMRPTFKEQDHLVVSKTTFGINVPLTPKHLYFDPELVERAGIAVFTVENMDVRDPNTLYFYLFPGKKQFIKRLMGKPGDTLYFYGGRIYGFDEKGNDISSQLQRERLSQIDHIPFMSFEGKVVPSLQQGQKICSSTTFLQMNEPVAKLSLGKPGELKGKMLTLSNPQADYSDLWGFKNFAQVRLLKADEVKKMTGQEPSDLGDALYFLELKHHPSFNGATLTYDYTGCVRPTLALSTSLIPLDEKLLRTLFNNLYTARFIVKEGIAHRYGSHPGHEAKYLPRLEGVPDGTYEFYYGRGYEVGFKGLTHELPPTHPLMQFDPLRTALLFNLGIEFNTLFLPHSKEQRLLPSRFAYFREGDLFVMGAPLLKKEDPALLSFVEREKKTGAPFVDNGPPDHALIKEYGLTIPEGMYLALGDNYAMSGDSREFGFVPEDNLRGTPLFIFWPAGERFGAPNQPLYPFINLSKVLVWTAAVAFSWAYITLTKRRQRKLLTFKP